MKKSGLILVFLSIIIIANIILFKQENSIDELIAVNDRPNEYMYTNNNNYPVRLSKDNIDIECFGNDEDIELAYKYLSVNVIYIKDNETLNTVTLNKGEQVKIKIYDEYNGDIYPSGSVSCSYNVNIGKTLA